MTPLLRILHLWRSEVPALALGVLMALLSAAAVAALALTAGAAPAALGGVLIVAALRGMGAARVVLRYTERLATHRATFRAQTALRVWMFRGLARRSAGGLGFMRRGDALARLVGDVDALDGLYLRIIVPLAALLLLLVAVAVVLGGLSPALAIGVCVLLGVGGLLAPWFAARATTGDGTRLAEAAAGLRVAALDALGGLREVRAFGNEGRMLATLQSREAALFDTQRVVARHTSRAMAAAMLCGQAGLLLVVLAGLPAAVVLPCVLLAVAAFDQASAMPRAGAIAGHAAAAAARVLAVADQQPGDRPDIDAAPAHRPGCSTALRFEDVGFAWPGRLPVFDGLTLDIPAGSRVAILGPSGSGKSTLAALALQVAAPQRGRVLLGGTDSAALASADVRSQVAWLSQATHVFADTIRQNLLLGSPGADDAALWLALAQAGLADVVRDLPDGLDTWIGEGGAGLSGGQQRRVALARALLSTAPILILDEPATGLDDAAERAFFQTLNDAAPGRTVILIVHRLLGVERLDRIWRLSGGRAVSAAG